MTENINQIVILNQKKTMKILILVIKIIIEDIQL